MTSRTVLADIHAARSSLEDGLRDVILAAAARVMSEEGPAALTVRRVAEAVNGSTKLIYTHFGGKDGLIEALYLHSFAGLTAAIAAHADKADPHVKLIAMTKAYRRFALSEPALYDVMFGDLGRAWQVPLPLRREAWKSFDTIRQALGAVMPQDRQAQVTRNAHLLWAGMHGVISLEIRNLIGPHQDRDDLFDLAVHAVLAASGVALSAESTAAAE